MTIPQIGSVTEEQLAKLREPFPPEQIGKLPATPKRPALDYVGHAAVTDRLNKVLGLNWTYTIDQETVRGDGFWVRGTLFVGETSRVDYGDGDDPKEAIGNFLRRAAMRFGVAIDLWSRQELEKSDAVHVAGTRTPDRSGEGPNAGAAQPSPEPHFPADPATCDHKRSSGAPAKFTDADKVERCSKCGLPWIVVVEGTTADLGSATSAT